MESELVRLETAAILGTDVLGALADRMSSIQTDIKRAREELEALREEISLARGRAVRSA